MQQQVEILCFCEKQDSCLFQVLLFKDIDAQNEDGNQQRTEYHSHETEQRQSDDNSEYRDERMGVCHLFLENKADEVIDIGYY